MILYTPIDIPLGRVGLLWEAGRRNPFILRIILPGEVQPKKQRSRREPPDGITNPDPDGIAGFMPRAKQLRLAEVIRQIREYGEGRDVVFTLADLDIDLCSPFQRRVLILTFKIPRGKVATYGGLARRLLLPRGARAAGTALAHNPFPLIIPCHRVVRTGGDLGGFGGGIPMKKALLAMEGVTFDERNRVRPEHIL
ncbi:MAG: methylated-DNA--[protein]-cysteine S-methyltransferase [Deltaproteobacteria bacterium]|nr:methylated-DNA--[protein]-cysteine S-methyltransferase [Deltaproteobacteria bacterium]